MRISDWSSDVCSSDLPRASGARVPAINPEFVRDRRNRFTRLLSREYGLVSTGIADAVSFGHVAPVPDNLLLTSCGELCPIIPDNRTNSGPGIGSGTIWFHRRKTKHDSITSLAAQSPGGGGAKQGGRGEGRGEG